MIMKTKSDAHHWCLHQRIRLYRQAYIILILIRHLFLGCIGVGGYCRMFALGSIKHDFDRGLLLSQSSRLSNESMVKVGDYKAGRHSEEV